MQEIGYSNKETDQLSRRLNTMQQTLSLILSWARQFTYQTLPFMMNLMH